MYKLIKLNVIFFSFLVFERKVLILKLKYKLLNLSQADASK